MLYDLNVDMHVEDREMSRHSIGRGQVGSSQEVGEEAQEGSQFGEVVEGMVS